MVGPRHWIDNHPVEVKPAVGIGHEALQQPVKIVVPASSTALKAAVGAVPEPTILQPAPSLTQLLPSSNPAAPYYAQSAPVPAAAAPSRPITAWSGAVVKNAAAAAAATLPAFTPDDFPAALSTKAASTATVATPKPALSYASMVGRPAPASQASRSIASVGSAADMTSESRRYDMSLLLSYYPRAS